MKNRNIEVPYDQIEQEALRALIEEYITRDGTYHGEKEMLMDEKIDLVFEQLKSGEAVITWDLYIQTGTIVLKKDIFKKNEAKDV
ncbi:YheU family protein [bacterium]|nr:YheU family protein [bacterium]